MAAEVHGKTGDVTSAVLMRPHCVHTLSSQTATRHCDSLARSQPIAQKRVCGRELLQLCSRRNSGAMRTDAITGEICTNRCIMLPNSCHSSYILPYIAKISPSARSPHCSSRPRRTMLPTALVCTSSLLVTTATRTAGCMIAPCGGPSKSSAAYSLVVLPSGTQRLGGVGGLAGADADRRVCKCVAYPDDIGAEQHRLCLNIVVRRRLKVRMHAAVLQPQSAPCMSTCAATA